MEFDPSGFEDLAWWVEKDRKKALRIIKLIKEASTFKEGIKCAFVVNRKIVNTAIGRDVNEALVDYEYPTLKTAIHQRVIFAECAAPGSTVIEMENKGQAAKEIKKLANEILEMI